MPLAGQLVIITGPIAAGKSSVSRGLAARYRSAGQTAVVADLDELFFGPVYAPRDRYGEVWAHVHSVYGALVAAWLHTGVDAVIADGPFHDAAENAALLGEGGPTPPRTRVHLATSYEVGLARVRQEPERVASADPQFLRRTYDRYLELAAQMPPCDVEFDTDTTTIDEIVASLAARLIGTS